MHILDYRTLYLEQWMANLLSHKVHVFPEVFFDELYCHIGHHSHMI